MIDELRQKGWTFTYIGADQDVEKIAGGIGVSNALRFSANEASTVQMFAKERACRIAYYGNVAESSSLLNDKYDFFASADKEEE